MKEQIIKDLLNQLEQYNCLNISKQFKYQIIKFKRKLPFEVFNNFFSKCKSEYTCCNYITLYKQYLYLYEEYQFEKKNNLI